MLRAVDRLDAEEYTQALGQVCAGGYRQVALGKKLGVPEALGLTVEEWVEDHLGGYVRLSLPDRKEAVAELTEEGMSSREIGDVLGVSHTTVERDRGTDVPADRDEPTSNGAVPEPAGTDVPVEVIDEARERERARERVRGYLRAALDHLVYPPDVAEAHAHRLADEARGDEELTPERFRSAAGVAMFIAKSLEAE